MEYDRLLCGGIWCIVQLEYEYIEEDKKNGTPISIRKLDPIQMPHVDLDEWKTARKNFTQDEWMGSYAPVCGDGTKVFGASRKVVAADAYAFIGRKQL